MNLLTSSSLVIFLAQVLFLIADDLVSGRLVQVSDVVIKQDHAYHVIEPADPGQIRAAMTSNLKYIQAAARVIAEPWRNPVRGGACRRGYG